MRPPRPLIPQRRRIFVGCEGESEQGYAALLTRILAEAQLAVHLDAVLLQPGGGDPLAIVELAASKAAEREDRRGEAYEHRFVFLDRDKIGQTPQRDQRIATTAANANLDLIWQRPCHEALLLHHLAGCAQLQPPSTNVAGQLLTARWPTYQKAMPAARLAERLDAAGIARAAAVEPELRRFLQTIGLI